MAITETFKGTLVPLKYFYKIISEEAFQFILDSSSTSKS